MARYPEHPLAQLIDSGNFDKAREIMEKALKEGGSQRKAVEVLKKWYPDNNISVRSLWRYMAAVELNSNYEGKEGSEARWKKK